MNQLHLILIWVYSLLCSTCLICQTTKITSIHSSSELKICQDCLQAKQLKDLNQIRIVQKTKRLDSHTFWYYFIAQAPALQISFQNNDHLSCDVEIVQFLELECDFATAKIYLEGTINQQQKDIKIVDRNNLTVGQKYFIKVNSRGSFSFEIVNVLPEILKATLKQVPSKKRDTKVRKSIQYWDKIEVVNKMKKADPYPNNIFDLTTYIKNVQADIDLNGETYENQRLLNRLYKKLTILKNNPNQQ